MDAHVETGVRGTDGPAPRSALTHRSPGTPATFDWLALRERADAAARATDLVETLTARRAAPLRIVDLGSGTGSMARWLAPRLRGPQHWVLVDQDPVLITRAAADLPAEARDGLPVTAETRVLDVTTLRDDDLRDDLGAELVTASALLDVLTACEIDALARACTGAGVPALFTLTVSGQVRLEPSEPRDVAMAAAFDDHQRRTVDGRRLLGPDAGDAVQDAFVRLGADVHMAPSPWHLGVDDVELAAEWLHGWVAAACEQEPGLVRHAEAYLARRLASAEAGELRVSVGHTDLLAIP